MKVMNFMGCWTLDVRKLKSLYSFEHLVSSILVLEIIPIKQQVREDTQQNDQGCQHY